MSGQQTFFKSSPEDIFIDFRERRRRVGGEREGNLDVREKHQSAASCPHRKQESNLQSRYVP